MWSGIDLDLTSANLVDRPVTINENRWRPGRGGACHRPAGIRHEERRMRLRTHEERTFAEAGPGECHARHGGMAGFTLCELPAGHDGPHRDTEPDGQVWLWDGMDEI